MLNGYSTTQQIERFRRGNPAHMQVMAGGWTLSSMDYNLIEWEGWPGEECWYRIAMNGEPTYRGFWRPRPQETVTEDFLHGDLFIIHYRLIEVVD